jgi:hypothetical protein
MGPSDGATGRDRAGEKEHHGQVGLLRCAETEKAFGTKEEVGCKMPSL